MANPYYVTFVAVYEDGQRRMFEVSFYALQRGSDGQAVVIAAERQASGHLPPGRIVKVERWKGR